MTDIWHSLTQAQLLVVSLLGGIMTAVGLLLRTHIRNIVADKASADQVTQLEARMGQMDKRLTSIEEVLRHMPTSRDLAMLNVTMERLAGTVSTLDAKVVGVRDLLGSTNSKVERVEDHLLASRG